MTDTGPPLGAGYSVRPLMELDGPEFVSFISRVPDGERRFLKEDLQHPDRTFASFFPADRARRLVAVDGGGHVVGLAGAFPADGWSTHVAELRVLVSADHRRHGIGRALARAALIEALKLGCTHAFVEVIAEQDGLVAMFQDLGFEPQALLPDFVRDASGDFHDLLLLTLQAEALTSLIRLLSLEEMAS